MNKVFVLFAVLVFVVGAILTSSMAQAQTIPTGANIKAVVTSYTGPTANENGDIEVTLDFIFKDKNSTGIEINGVRASFDPDGTPQQVKQKFVNALIAEAQSDRYQFQLAAVDIMFLTDFSKGN